VTSRLWLVRHAETEWSGSGRLCGWMDVALNDRGREQARALAGRLAAYRFTTAWSSDLLRAVETARLAYGATSVDRRLRELWFGSLEGARWSDLEAPVQAEMLHFDGFAAPNGEDVASLRGRVHAFIRELPAGDHLVFTHGGVVRLLLREAGRDQAVEPGEVVVLPTADLDSAGRALAVSDDRST
jgi:probable phosphoglycerate mutase